MPEDIKIPEDPTPDNRKLFYTMDLYIPASIASIVF